MADLIEDEDGAPYPCCKHCGDQIALRPSGDWAHVFQADDGHRWYLWRCQHTVPYGQNAEHTDHQEK